MEDVVEEMFVYVTGNRIFLHVLYNETNFVTTLKKAKYTSLIYIGFMKIYF